MRARPATNATYRIVVAIVGFVVLCVGIVAIPYPGPGWAIVFIGLGILATEFRWAQRLLKWVKARYDRVMAWFARQGRWVQAAGIVLTTAVVLVTLWMMGALGWFAALVGLDWPALKSPIGVGG